VVKREDYLEMVGQCYEKFQDVGGDAREGKIDQCIQKWRRVFSYMDSPELIESYTKFYKKTKKE
jgi:hypothetical protein